MSTVGRGAAIFGCAGPELGADETAFFRDYDPFGFILFARNIDNPDQVRSLCADLRASVGRNAPILVDQEGGRVQRLRPPHWQDWLPPLDLVQRAGDRAARALDLRYRLIAAELRAVGVDANCAPCADVIGPHTHPFLANRCYGDTPAVVAHLARVVAEAHLAAGVLPVIKHLPGHGRSSVDTHHGLPVVTANLAALQTTDFAPFRALSDLPMAMTAHLVFTALDPEHPATQSPAAIRAIRQDIGFGGLLMTDDLNMQALTGSLADRAARSIAAGVDIALHCKGDLAEMQNVAGAAGDMAESTLARAAAALLARRGNPPLDPAALQAELDALLPGWPHA